MDFSEAVLHIESQTLSPVYVLVGTEIMLKQMFLEALNNRLSGSSQSINIMRYRYEEEGANNALFECRTLSFFTDQAVVVLENCTALTAGGKAKFDTSELEEYLTNPVPNKYFVITVDADKLDERKKIVKLAKKHQVVVCTKPKDEDAMRILRVITKKDGIEISKEALEKLWRRSVSIASCRTDLLKLWTYTNHAPIENHDVDELVTPKLEDNVFDWLNSVVKGDIGIAFKVLEDVRHAGYDVFALLAMIARQLRLMWYAKVFSRMGYTQQQIATRVSAHPYAIKVAIEQSRVFSIRRLEQLIVKVADAEFDVKSGKRDMEQTLSLIVAECAVTTEVIQRVQ